MLKNEFKRAIFRKKFQRSSKGLEMMMYSAGTHAQWESFYKQLYIQAFSDVLRVLASFHARARGIKFYDVYP